MQAREPAGHVVASGRYTVYAGWYKELPFYV